MSAPLKQREVLQPSRLRARRRKLRIVKSISYLTLFLVFLGGAIGVFYIPALRVRDVSVFGTKTIESKAIEQTLHGALLGKKWFILPKDNAFLFSEEKLRETAVHQYPKIKKIDIRLSNFHTIEAHIEERTAYALWCGEKIEGGIPCVYMDDSGVLYEPSAEYSGNAYVRWYGEVIGAPLGGVYLGERSASLFPLVAELGKDGVVAVEVVVEKNGDVLVLSEDGFELLFTLEKKPEALLASLRTAKKSDALKDKNFSDLQYLDMRFSDSRLYYKFK